MNRLLLDLFKLNMIDYLLTFGNIYYLGAIELNPFFKNIILTWWGFFLKFFGIIFVISIFYYGYKKSETILEKKFIKYCVIFSILFYIFVIGSNLLQMILIIRYI